MPNTPWALAPDRCFDADPAQRGLARALYTTVKDLPLICPHGHVNPALLADPGARLGTPSELFIIPDHYIFRMLYSQGIRLEDLGVPTRDGAPVEGDHRQIWQRFAERFYLFRGTPTALWSPAWPSQIAALADAAGSDVVDYASFIRALEQRRAFFKQQGALATDHATLTPYTARLSAVEAEAIFMRALSGAATDDDAARFTGHMLIEFARMSAEDGLVMQLHVGSLRNHNQALFNRFGPDMGADIPIATEWTRNLRALLDEYGANPRFRLILFTLDESAYSRELAPLAGHYPAVLLGPPWWFFDSVNGMRRYLDSVVETAGLYNLAGFNDDTRAFASIPARHDVWRRVTCDWLAGLAVQGLLAEDEAADMAYECAYGLAKRAYRVPE